MKKDFLSQRISMIRKNKKLFLAIQVSSLLIVSGSLGGLFFYTDVYDDIQSGIVEVLCLSCIKLRVISSGDFTFETADSNPHPEFVKNSLKTKGPLLIQYGEPGCAACTRMIDNVMKKYFKIEFGEEKKSFETQVNVDNISFYYIYIYKDDNAPKTEKTESFWTYDKDNIGGFPMFTIVTIEYDHGGDIKPYYTSLYGEFEDDYNYEKMYERFVELLEFSNELYDRNIVGYK